MFIREQSLSRGTSQSAVRRRWRRLCVEWPSHSQWPRKKIIFITAMRLPILQLSCRPFFFNTKHHNTQVCQPPYSPDLAPCYFWLFPKPKSPLKGRDLWMRRSPVHKLSQRLLTADWLAPRESDCSLMHIKVSSDWLPSYIKATLPVLEIFKMAGYTPDSSRTFGWISAQSFPFLCPYHVNCLCFWLKPALFDA